MIVNRTSGWASLERSPVLASALLLLLATPLVFVTFGVPELGAGGVMLDFDAFYIVGQMIRDGRLAEAYDPDVMRQMQTEISGNNTFMPWTYPPLFDLVAAVLPFGARGVSYALFTGGTFIVYLVVLRRLAGAHLSWVLLAVFPALFIAIAVGQNSFITGALIGLFCLGFRKGRAIAGVPLGLLLIKPHLGLGLGLLVLVSRQWRTLLVVVLIGLAGGAVSTLAFGAEVWPAFLQAARAAGGFLEKGYYPMYRMSSVYASLFSLGAPPPVAIAAQGLSALLACAMIVQAALNHWKPQQVLGLAVLGTLAISPYNYDYDLVILGVALALLAADLLRTASSAQKVGLLGLSWVACGSGLWQTVQHLGAEAEADHLAKHHSDTLAGISFLLLIGLVWFILHRQRVAQGQARSTPAFAVPEAA